MLELFRRYLIRSRHQCSFSNSRPCISIELRINLSDYKCLRWSLKVIVALFMAGICPRDSLVGHCAPCTVVDQFASILHDPKSLRFGPRICHVRKNACMRVGKGERDLVSATSVHAQLKGSILNANRPMIWAEKQKIHVSWSHMV